MLSYEDTAWTVYIILFFLFSGLLVIQSRNHVILMLPFILFSVLSMIAHIAMIARRYNHETSLLVVASRSPAVSYLSMFSLFLYIGLVEYELIDIEQSKTRRGGGESAITVQFAKRRKPASYWLAIGLAFVYCSVTIALFVLMVVLDDSKPSTRASEAALVTVLILLTLLLTRRSRIVLFVLLVLALTGLSLEMWLLHAMVKDPATADANSVFSISTWLLMEALLVYFPIMMMLALVSWKPGSLGSVAAAAAAAEATTTTANTQSTRLEQQQQ
ncbi:hypothetical protein BX666DRAFT_1903828 [Dichotomocladium elegans]|nr:hypothetical protein BX666DRAFT_1903828 [Dichotomocladium elegans]